MHKMWTLALAMYKSGGGLNGGAFLGKKKKIATTGRTGSTALVAVCFLPMAYMVLQISAGMYAAFRPEGQQALLLQFANAISAYLTLMFGIYHVASTLYFSSDNVYLLSLPVSPSQLAGARFINLLFYEYMVNAVVWIPYIVYGVMDNAGVAYYASAAVSFALLPVIPLAVCCFLVMLLMRLMPFFRNKDVFTIVAMSLLIVGMIAFSMILSSAQTMMGLGGNMPLGAISADSGLLLASKYLFPGLSFSANALAAAGSGQSLVSLLLYIACCALAFSVFLLLARFFYLRAVLSAQTVHARKPAREKRDDGQRSVFSALLHKEWRLLSRSPTALLNCVVGNFLMPVIFLISIFSSQAARGQGNMLRDLAESIPWGQDGVASLVLCVCFAGGMFLGGTNLISTTALSREGSANFAQLRSFPVSYMRQAAAKISLGVALGIGAVIVMLVAAGILLSMPIALIVPGLIVAAVAVLLVNILGFLLDLRRPRIHWENEQQAIKQNFNGVIVIFGGMALGGVIAVAAFMLLKGPVIVGVALVLAGAALSALLLRWLHKVITPWMMRIEL